MSLIVIRETMRRHLTHIGFIVFVVLLAIVAFGVARFDRPGSVWPSLIWLLAVITGCGPIGPEFSSGTLQLILVKPVNRSAYLLSRVSGVTGVVWIATLVAFCAETFGRLLWHGPLPWSALVNTLTDSVLVIALLTLLGSLTRAYFNVAIFLALQFGISITIGILGMIRRAPPQIARALTVIDRNLFPDAPPQIDRDWILLVLSNAAIALLIACFAFRNREVPYGAD
jgi:ABC-type transport system involved in multi-copper enzyme maturation permease subunit